jgi:hypothetical protein
MDRIELRRAFLALLFSVVLATGGLGAAGCGEGEDDGDGGSEQQQQDGGDDEGGGEDD